jgi:hypothetical protein
MSTNKNQLEVNKLSIKVQIKSEDAEMEKHELLEQRILLKFDLQRQKETCLNIENEIDQNKAIIKQMIETLKINTEVSESQIEKMQIISEQILMIQSNPESKKKSNQVDHAL